MKNEDFILEKYKHRRDLIGLFKFWLFVFMIYAIINGIGMARFDISGMQIFLKCFNGVVMWGVILVAVVFSIFENNMREYGSFRKPKFETEDKK